MWIWRIPFSFGSFLLDGEQSEGCGWTLCCRKDLWRVLTSPAYALPCVKRSSGALFPAPSRPLLPTGASQGRPFSTPLERG